MFVASAPKSRPQKVLHIQRLDGYSIRHSDLAWRVARLPLLRLQQWGMLAVKEAASCYAKPPAATFLHLQGQCDNGRHNNWDGLVQNRKR